jgi:glycosyltransferase involved in cell wall biosynthesis
MGTKKITVTALTSGATDPSTRFRIRQYIEPLALHGIEVREFCPRISKYATLPKCLSGLGVIPKILFFILKILSRVPGLIRSQQTQITWINRELIPGRKSLVNLVGGIRVFDIDDAVWVGSERSEKRIQEILRNVDAVFAGNNYLADWCRPYCSRVFIVPTAIDTSKFVPRRQVEARCDFVIGWTGTKYTIKYLYDIERSLQIFFENYVNVVLLVVSDEKPKDDFLAGYKTRWIKWSTEIEASSIQEMDVGLMPLPNDEWTKGKCSFKMIQYMASGIPSVVSPVGMNEMILNLGDVGIGAVSIDDWVESLSKLYHDRNLCAEMGRTARHFAEKRFSVDVVSCEIANAFRDIKNKCEC